MTIYHILLKASYSSLQFLIDSKLERKIKIKKIKNIYKLQ